VQRNVVKIGTVGYGTVGSGVVRMLRRKRAAIRRQVGVDIEIKRIAEKDPGRVRDKTVPRALFTPDMQDILDDPDIRVVVELIGGRTAARELINGALSRGKHVVTANKAVLAAYWREIFSLADRTGTTVQFESSVMAGVPVIRGLHEGLAGNTVRSMMGILNGTTNFILTRMSRPRVDFARAVAEARKRGLCEADPTLDVDGLDAAHKLAILGSLASGRWLPPDAIHTEGIRGIEPMDLATGRKEFGADLKLLAIYKRRGTCAEARVHPTFLARDHPLAAVRDEFNAVYVTGDASGPVMLYGKGAGQMPAASGVVSDVIALSRGIAVGMAGRLRGPSGVGLEPVQVVPMDAIESRFYLRFTTVDRPGVLSAIAGALGKQGVSIASCYQRGRSDEGPVSVVMTTHTCREGAARAAIKRIDAMKDIVRKRTVAIRMED